MFTNAQIEKILAAAAGAIPGPYIVTEKAHLGIEGRVEGVKFEADDNEDGETQG